MNTCKTCKHWTVWGDIIEGEKVVPGSCEILGEESSSDDNNNVRVYSDSLPITTEENFGCIHHSERK